MCANPQQSCSGRGADARRQVTLGRAAVLERRSYGIYGGNHGSNLPGDRSRSGFGHNISHSHRRTKRRFDPNVQKKTYYVPSLRRNVTLTLSAKGIKVIDARGIEKVVKDLLARGEKI